VLFFTTYYLKNKWLNGFINLAQPEVKCSGLSTTLNTKQPSSEFVVGV
jgi:hypothetical protein